MAITTVGIRMGKGILVLLALMMALQSSRGVPINFSFQGAVATVNDMMFQLDGSVTNGSRFEGYYIFDDSTPDTNPDATVGDYWHRSGAVGIVVKAGSYVFRTHPDHVEFLVEIVDRDRDNYLVRSYHNICSTGLLVEHIAWQLEDPTGLAVTSVALSTQPPDLTAFESEVGLTISGSSLDGFLIRGHLTSINATPAIVPTRPEVEIAEAVELKFPTLLGYFYQVQYSHDMREWTNIGEKVLGTGEAVRTFARKVENRHTYYRVEIANSPE